MTQRTGPVDWEDEDTRAGADVCPILHFKVQLKRTLAKTYLWIPQHWVCSYIRASPLQVTHLRITAGNSLWEFSAALSCRNLVLSDDSTLNRRLYISTPSKDCCIFHTSKSDTNSPPLSRDVTWRTFRKLVLFTNRSILGCNWTSYHSWHAARQIQANNLGAITAAFEEAYVQRAVQKISDEPRDCAGLHFIQRRTLNGK